MLNVKTLLNKMLNNIEYRELVWTNPNPSAQFTAQTITLSLDNNDEVEVGFIVSTATKALSPLVRVPVGSSGRALAPYQVICWRGFSVNANGVSFENGVAVGSYSGQPATNNGFTVPMFIYRIRKLGGVLADLIKTLCASLERGCAEC